VESFEGCREACKLNHECFQFRYRANATSDGQPIGEWNGQCGLRMAISLGQKVEESRAPAKSGYDLERIELWTRKRTCKEAVFLTEWDLSGNLEPPN